MGFGGVARLRRGWFTDRLGPHRLMHQCPRLLFNQLATFLMSTAEAAAPMRASTSSQSEISCNFLLESVAWIRCAWSFAVPGSAATDMWLSIIAPDFTLRKTRV